MKKQLLLILMLFSISILSAQSSDAAYKKAKQEIEATFGHFPSFFQVLPKNAVPGMWQYFQAHNDPNAAIPPKYRELIQLAVASQIPCNYCIYFHTEAAIAYGATEEEVKEAVLDGASTRNWSMILQGNQVDLEEFKEEFQKMMAYMAEQAAKNK